MIITTLSIFARKKFGILAKNTFFFGLTKPQVLGLKSQVLEQRGQKKCFFVVFANKDRIIMVLIR